MHQRKPWRTTCWGARHFATAVILWTLLKICLGQKYVILDLKRFFAYWWHLYLQCRFKTIENFPVFISNWAPNILLDRNSRTKKIFCPVYGLAYMKGQVKITAVWTRGKSKYGSLRKASSRAKYIFMVYCRDLSLRFLVFLHTDTR